MSYLSIINNTATTLLSDKLVIPADEVQALANAHMAARRLAVLQAEQEARVVQAEQEAMAAGRKAGEQRGKASAAAILTRRLLELEQASEAERAELRGKAVDHALQIVRRIASRLGDEQTLAALADEAARELMPDHPIVLQVHPDRLTGVSDRLAALSADASVADKPVFQVEPEASLSRSECRLRAPGGNTVQAGLHTQLRRIEQYIQQQLPTVKGAHS